MEFLTSHYVPLAVIAFGIIGVYITVDAVSNSIVSVYLKVITLRKTIVNLYIKAFHPREGLKSSSQNPQRRRKNRL